MRVNRFVFIGIIILIAVICISEVPGVREYLKTRNDMASWLQALTSAIAIAAAICLANVPIKQANKDRINLRKRNADIFVAKNKLEIRQECRRLERVIDSFNKMKMGNGWGSVAEEAYKDFISDIFKMQIRSITDYEMSYDLSAIALSLLSESQTSYLMILRQLHEDAIGNEDLIDSEYIGYFSHNREGHFNRWFESDRKCSSILKYLEAQKVRLNKLYVIVCAHDDPSLKGSA